MIGTAEKSDWFGFRLRFEFFFVNGSILFKRGGGSWEFEIIDIKYW